MLPRHVLTGVVVCAACGKPAHDATLDAGGAPDTFDAAAIDASIDASADAMVPDTTPPAVASITPAPGTSAWLHAPIRIIFDEPIAAASVATATVSAQLSGTAVPVQLAFEAPSTLVITVPASERGVGMLAVHVTGSFADLAGNLHADPIDASFMIAPWSSVAVSRGVAVTAPELAVDDDGTVYAAWLVGSGATRQAVVSVLYNDAWSSLGGTLGASAVTSVAIALDENGVPLVAWSEANVVHVARWANGWVELASPGAGAQVALVTPAGGSPMVARFGATASVQVLASGAWQAIGVDLPIEAPAGDAMLAAVGANRPVLGWIDGSAQLRVYRYDASWTALAPIAVSTGSRFGLAARGTTIAVAWDQHAGSWGVLAAQLGGAATSWTRLGRALDVDISGDALAPAIAIDATGAPIVAWTELVETSQRGVLARWTGSAWSIAGGVSWLGHATAAPSRAHLALHRGEAAVAATSAAGAVHVTRFNGPRVASTGIATRASIAGCAFSPTSPPASLAQTGCFTVPGPGKPVPHAGLVPFDVVSELWSDGAKKRRWIALPDGAAMTQLANGSWTAPAGSILIKEFALETTPGNPATRLAVETRFMINDGTAWQGFSYRWNAAGTDATLQPDTEVIYSWPMDDGSTHAHVYPSRNHCRSCHYYAYGPVLGLRTAQLARWFDYNGVIADQLATLAQLGIAPASSGTPFVSPHEPSETWERRARGYMAANCAHCHNPDYLAIRDLRYTTSLAQTRLCESIMPGSPADSRVYQLVTSRPGMPALGTIAVDPLAQQLLGSWITGMTSCP